jgi:acetyl esterase/lipase
VSFSYDPEFAEVIGPFADALTANPAPPGDWKTLRETVNAALALLAAAFPDVTGVQAADYEIPGHEGATIAARLYRNEGAEPPGSAVLYIHGGGMVLGSMDLYDKAAASYTAESGVPVLSVDYRLAPEHPHPTPVEDCFAALTWLRERAAEFGIDAARIALMGDSAGGGLAAGTAILARDRGVPLARQILIYPMLDDRNVVPDPELVPFVTWSYDSNLTGWGSLLGDLRGTDDVPATAAPARLADFGGLAAAYIEVGELDIFRDEDIEYARRLGQAGVSAELHVHPGVPHGFDAAGGATSVGIRAHADRIRVLQSL